MYEPGRFAPCDTIPEVIDVESENINTISTSQAVRLRDKLHNYFLQPRGAIPIQWRYAGLPNAT